MNARTTAHPVADRLRPRRTGITGISLAATALIAGGCAPAWGEGHGPTFALATPTLTQGQWSSDTTALVLSTTEGETFMAGQMLGYGITEDWDVSLAVGSPMVNRRQAMPRTRAGSMMLTTGDQVELTTRWRFHREAPAVGTRRESTLILGSSAPYDSRPNGMKIGPSAHIGAVTGYASRTWYWWLGGGFQRYADRGGDRPGDLPYLTATVAYRPPAWAGDFPQPDWRVFMEAVAEFPQRNRMDGEAVAESGGQRALIGPTFLGLFATGWGVSGGIMFPVHQRLHGDQPRENLRGRIVATYWF